MFVEGCVLCFVLIICYGVVFESFEFNFLVVFVNSELFWFFLVGIFNYIMIFWFYCLLLVLSGWIIVNDLFMDLLWIFWYKFIFLG